MRQSINFGNHFKIDTADLLSSMFLLFLPAIFFWRETLGLSTLGDADVAFWFFPIWTLAAEQVQSGHLPLWNPQLYSGTALFAEWQPGLLDPFNWIHLLGPTSRTLTIAQEATFSVALLGTFGFARRLGMKRRASIVSAVIYALSGYAVARTIYPGLFHIHALMPLVLLSIERLSQMGRWRDVILGGLFVAWQILAAHPQPFVYSSLLAGAYILFRFSVAERPITDGERKSLVTFSNLRPVFHNQWLRNRLRFLLQCTMMFIIGAALTAVQVMPAWEVAGQSVRQQVPFEFFTWHSLHPITLLTMIFPFFHGQGKAIYHLPYWGAYWHHNEAQIYLGVLAISLATAAALCLWRGRSGSVLFWSIVAVGAVALTLGKYLWPLAQLFYRIPLLNQFRSPNRHWMEVAMAVAVLAGYAVDQILRGGERALARVAQVVALILTLLSAGVGTFILWRRHQAEAIIRSLPDMSFLPPGFLQLAGPEFFLPLISSTLLLVALMIFLRTGRRDRWSFLLLALLIIDFNLYASFAPISNPAKFESLIGQSMPPELIAKQNERQPIRYHLMLNPTESSFSPFWFYGNEMVTGYDPLLSLRYRTFSGINEAGRSTLPTLLDAQDRTLDLLNVNFVLIPESMFNSPALDESSIEYGGITFANDHSSEVELRSGQRADFAADEAVYDTLAIVSTLTNSGALADGAEVAKITVGCGSGERMTTALRAGHDTAEWAYDRSDVRPYINHSRAPLAASRPGDEAGSFQAHSYLARLSLPASVARCGKARFIQTTSEAEGNVTVGIHHIALYDSVSGHSTPAVKTISGSLRDNTRWREISVKNPDIGYRGLRVYENLKALPRIWTVDHAEPRSDQEQLQLIRGEPIEPHAPAFDPLESALISPADAAKLDPNLLNSPDKPEKPEKADEQMGSDERSTIVRIVKREPAKMIITADTTKPSLLVMSEVSFPGWHATVDGREIELLRINYLLRGLSLASGKHQIEIYYQPRSLMIGAVISATTVFFLLVLVLLGRYKQRLT